MRLNVKYKDLIKRLSTEEAIDYRDLKNLENFQYAGFSFLITGAGLAGGCIYNVATSTGQADLQKAFKEYKFPTQRADVTYQDGLSPMGDIVNKAIDHQAPTPRSQTVRLEKGVFKLDAIETDRKKLDVEKLNSEIRTNAQEFIDTYYHTTYLGIGAGVTMSLAGAFLAATAHKTVNRLHAKYIASQPDNSPKPPCA